MTRASVIVPTYNEAENIVPFVDDVLQTLWSRGVDAEVLVVDDDSPDGTWRIAREEFRGGRVRVIRRTDERGLGSAVVRGIREAQGELCAVMDADYQHPPAAVGHLLEAFDVATDVDVAVGSRYCPGGGIDGWSQTRRLVSWAGAMVARLSVGRTWSISDPMSGFFAVRRSAVAGRLDDLEPDGYKILLEILARMDPRHVVEVPYTFQERRAGESKLTTAESARFLRHVTRLAVERGVRATDTAVLAAGFALTVFTGSPVFAAFAAAGVAVERGVELGSEVRETEVDVLGC